MKAIVNLVTVKAVTVMKIIISATPGRMLQNSFRSAEASVARLRISLACLKTSEKSKAPSPLRAAEALHITLSSNAEWSFQQPARAAIATALCLSFAMYFPLRAFSAAAATRTAVELKTESQYRSEAGRYDRAINAISGIVTMKLDTPDELKQSLAILDRERPNLKLHRSKLIVMAISDATFSSAVKKRMPDKQSAEALLKELNADQKAVLKLGGARITEDAYATQPDGRCSNTGPSGGALERSRREDHQCASGKHVTWLGNNT